MKKIAFIISIVLICGCSFNNDDETDLHPIFTTIAGNRYISNSVTNSLKYFNLYTNRNLTNSEIVNHVCNQLYRFNSTYTDYSGLIEPRRNFYIIVCFTDLSDDTRKSDYSASVSGFYEESTELGEITLYIQSIRMRENNQETILFDSGTIDSGNETTNSFSISYSTSGVTLSGYDLELSLESYDKKYVQLSDTFQLAPFGWIADL